MADDERYAGRRLHRCASQSCIILHAILIENTLWIMGFTLYLYLPMGLVKQGGLAQKDASVRGECKFLFVGACVM